MNKTKKNIKKNNRTSKKRGMSKKRGISKKRGGAASEESESEKTVRTQAQKNSEYYAIKAAIEEEALFKRLYPEKARQKERDTKKNYESTNEWEARKKRMNAYDASIQKIQAEQTWDAMLAREGRYSRVNQQHH